MDVLVLYLVLFCAIVCFGTDLPWAVCRFIGYWGFRIVYRLSDEQLKYILMRGEEEAESPLSDVEIWNALEEEAKSEPWKTSTAVASRLERFKDGVIWR